MRISHQKKNIQNYLGQFTKNNYPKKIKVKILKKKNQNKLKLLKIIKNKIKLKKYYLKRNNYILNYNQIYKPI